MCQSQRNGSGLRHACAIWATTAAQDPDLAKLCSSQRGLGGYRRQLAIAYMSAAIGAKGVSKPGSRRQHMGSSEKQSELAALSTTGASCLHCQVKAALSASGRRSCSTARKTAEVRLADWLLARCHQHVHHYTRQLLAELALVDASAALCTAEIPWLEQSNACNSHDSPNYAKQSWK